MVDALKASAPVEPTVFQQRRLLERVLERQRSRRAWDGTVMFLRPIVVVAVLLMAGVTAAATFGHTWIAQGLRSLRSRPPVVATASEPIPRLRRHAAPIAEPVAPPPSQPEPVAEAAPAPVAIHAAPRLASRSHAIRPEARTVEGRTEDPSLVVDAIRALRTDRDWRRASSLLATYLRTYPHGALSEEAVALSIEAAAAGRSPSAATFAAQYLREYPHGRFHRAAEQALDQRQP